MTRWWAELPAGRVVRLRGADADSIALSIEPLPESAPAIVTYFASGARSVSEIVDSVSFELEAVVIGLYPAWLPGAEGIAGRGGTGVSAVRTLALRMATVAPHFGPFLADLAEISLRGAELSPESRARRFSRFPTEVRIAGLARVLAASFDRPHAAILVDMPAGLTPAAEEVLVAACEWLAHRGDLGIWLTGAPLVTVDRVEAVTIRLPADVTSLAADVANLPAEVMKNLANDLPQPLETRSSETRAAHPMTHPADKHAITHPAMGGTAKHSVMGHVITHPPVGRSITHPAAGRAITPPAAGRAIAYPAVAGMPHPASDAEQALEAALASCDWATGRAWNQIYQSHPLINPIRVDLLWRDERCVVEVDGPEHRAPLKFAADRRRDVQLQLDGFAVLRFTNAHVITDTKAVVNQMEQFLRSRRLGTLKG